MKVKIITKLFDSYSPLLLCCKTPQYSVCLSLSKIGLESREELLPNEEGFDEVTSERRTKRSFLKIIENFCSKQSHARGHVEFINSALTYMKEYGLQKDLDIYKSLLNIFPKGPLIPRNVFQRGFLYYPQQQICCVKLLDDMEWFGVQPDKEIHDLVVNIFGEWNYATKKVKRMMYWMPKLKNSNIYLDRRKIEGRNLSAIDFGYLALKMISRDPGIRITFVQINDAKLDELDKWLLSSQSPLQAKLLRDMSQNTVFVDGPNKVYLMDHSVDYIGLFADRKLQYYEKYEANSQDDADFQNWKSQWDEGRMKTPKCSIHEQQHETVLALSVFGKVCRETAVAWINHLQESNPVLNRFRVLFRTKQTGGTSISQLF